MLGHVSRRTVLFTDGTIDKVLEVATDLANSIMEMRMTYHLFLLPNQSNKVARLAVALAALHIQLMIR